MAQGKCIICGTATKNKCSRCKSAAYCSRACQKIDLPLHKLLCSQYQAFLKTRPAPNTGPETYDAKIQIQPSASNHRLAILFPAEGTAPKLIWMNCTTHETGNSRYFFVAEPAQISQDPPHVRIWMASNACLAGPLTESIAALNVGYEYSDVQAGAASPIRWGGDNIITGLDANKNNEGDEDEDEEDLDESDFYRDATLADFRYAFNWYVRYNDCYECNIPNPYVLRDKSKWTKAVKISSSLDMRELGKKKYIEVEVKDSHNIFQSPSGISQAARAVGFPLLAMKLELGDFWASKEKHIEHDSQPENQEVAFLIMNPDIGTMKNRERNAAHSKWDEKVVATTIVARQDEKDVNPASNRSFNLLRQGSAASQDEQ
ncbi:hypothetical protein N431DRAFT_518976 [Stipitochalara longipes BDJ]|nr:hypothetical protein N431DRAFT_518976 [Stipitochalara longipes BDJ]